ncbi:MAG: hypothetical protein Kow0062_10660 [Acidobacteriota bacterium]
MARGTRRAAASGRRRGTPDAAPAPFERVGRVGLGVLVVLAWVYALFGAEGLLRQWERRQELEQARARLAAERARTEALRGRVEALTSDDLAIEREIRRQLDYQRPGELVLILGDDDPLGDAESERDPSNNGQ